MVRVPRSGSAEEFPRVEEAAGIEGVFDGLMEGAAGVVDGVGEPAFFGDADAVFAADDAAEAEDVAEEIVEGGVGAGALIRVLHVWDHDIDVDVAVAGVAEAGDWEAAANLEACGEFDEIDEAAAGDDDVLVEFCEAGVAETVGEFAAHLPEGFDFRVGGAGFDADGTVGAEETSDFAEFGADAGCGAVEFGEEMGFAWGDAVRAEVFACGVEGEAVGDFEGRGEEA